MQRSAVPVLAAVYALALVSILYEPMRSSLFNLGQAVGGVGGVGGLTNQWGPTQSCTTTVGGERAPWCFQPGRLGFTPFAGVALTAVSLPLFAAGIVGYLLGKREQAEAQLVSHAPLSVQSPDAFAARQALVLTGWTMAWCTMSLLWFVVPLTAYLAAPFYQANFWQALIGIGICAAFPLSWHMAFVSLPVSSAPFLAPMLGLTGKTFMLLHVRIAWCTVSWACLHTAVELVYLIAQGQLISNLLLRMPAWQDSLIFLLGAVAAVLLASHVALAVFRKHPALRPTFLRNHRLLAAAVLLASAAHWWPFVFFLAPAIAASATGLAVRAGKLAPHERHNALLALAMATVAAVVGIVVVWAMRQQFMLFWGPGDFRTPFVFPPAAVALAFGLARSAAAAVLWGVAQHESDDSEAAPLLPAQHKASSL